MLRFFSRVGGGIYTKSADIGADLVGKVEAGIPEDDPRNPGVIADNVGDNVGDVAGMGSDIFESYCGSMIASIAIASTMTIGVLGERSSLMFLPLALASIGLICSIIGIALVRLYSKKSPEVALRIGTIGASGLFIILSLFLIMMVDVNTKIWGAVLFGAVGVSSERSSLMFLPLALASIGRISFDHWYRFSAPLFQKIDRRWRCVIEDHRRKWQ